MRPDKKSILPYILGEVSEDEGVIRPAHNYVRGR